MTTTTTKDTEQRAVKLSPHDRMIGDTIIKVLRPILARLAALETEIRKLKQKEQQ